MRACAKRLKESEEENRSLKEKLVEAENEKKIIKTQKTEKKNPKTVSVNICPHAMKEGYRND